MSGAVQELQPHAAADYTAMLRALLPPGKAWEGKVLASLLAACANELVRVDAAARLLPAEVNPAETQGGLTDWERVLGLPDACLPAGTSFTERRESVLAKLRDVGRQDLAYWYDLAETLGYGGPYPPGGSGVAALNAGAAPGELASPGMEAASGVVIPYPPGGSGVAALNAGAAPGELASPGMEAASGVVIEEHWPFICGLHECGDPQSGWTPESGMTPERYEQDMGWPIGRCGPPEMRYWINVLVYGDRLIRFRCGTSECPEVLLDWRGAQALECVMRRDKQAHILLTFEYRD